VTGGDAGAAACIVNQRLSTALVGDGPRGSITCEAPSAEVRPAAVSSPTRAHDREPSRRQGPAGRWSWWSWRQPVASSP